MLLKNSNRLRASSLLESVIAITVIGLCTVIGMMVFGRTYDSSTYTIDIEAEQTVKKMWLATQLNKEYTNEQFTFDRYSVKRETRPYDLKGTGTLVYFTVERNNKKKKYTYFAKSTN
jgi:hypothetical protein